MIQNILYFSLTKRWLIVAISIGIIGLGVYCFNQLKIEAYPDIADTNVVIITKYNGRAAEEVEQKITIPIERALNNVPKVMARRSRTIFGLSVVQLNFEDGTDDYFARQQVFQQLQNADLPAEADPKLAPLTSAIGEIYRYVVDAPASYTPMDLRVLQDWVIIPKLLQAPGVADVATFGGPVKQFHILTSPVNLRKYDLRLQDIIDAVNKNNENTGGGIVIRGEQGFAIRGIGNISNVDDIQNIVLKSNMGVPVYIKNVATVEINPPTPSGILGFYDNRAKEDVELATEGIVLMRRQENPSEVLKALKEKIADLEANDLPKDVKLTIIYDRTFLVDHSLETVGHTLLEGITIAIVVIFIFLGSFRSAIVVAVTIPFSLLFAFIMMWLTNVPANLLSLGAIDFGIIVDGAGRMAENIIRRLQIATEEEKKKGFLSICISAAQEVGREIFFCVLIIILAYLPIFTMQRVEGKLFSPMAMTLAFALLGSMVCALTLIPVLISFAFKGVLEPKKEGRKRFTINFHPFKTIQKYYGMLLSFTLSKARYVLIGTLALLIAAGFYIRNLGTEFLPNLDEGSIWMRCILPSGTNIYETAKIAPIIRNIVKGFYPVDFVLTQSGRNDDGTDPIPSNRMEIMIVLKDYKSWADTLTKQNLINRIKERLEMNLPGAAISFGQPIIDQVMEIVTGSAAHLAVSVIGDDLVLMRQKGEAILNIVKNMKGSTGNNLEQEGPQAQISIDIDRQKAARYGINVNEIQSMIEVAIGGEAIGVLYDGAKRFDIMVRYYPENRSTLEAIEDLQVFSIKGAFIPMKEIANISYVEGQTNVYRLDGKRMITVRTNIAGRDQGGFVDELKQKVAAQIKLPEGYSILYGGQFENLDRAGKQLLLAVPMTLIIVFVVLLVLFKKISDTLIVFSCVPIGITGGALALLLRGYNFNISSGVGFISLFGISVMAGIMSLSFINNSVKKLKLLNYGYDEDEEATKKQEQEKKGLKQQSKFEPIIARSDIKNIVLEVCEEQLRPIMMVMIVAMLALFPAATSTGIGSDVQRPLATVIIGGLMATLLFSPFIVPSMYWVFKTKKTQ